MAMIHYPVPVHLQQAYSFLGVGEGSYPLSEKLAKEIVSLPMYAELSEEQIQQVWMRRLQTTPSDFLRLKFAAQAEESKTSRPQGKPRGGK